MMKLLVFIKALKILLCCSICLHEHLLSERICTVYTPTYMYKLLAKGKDLLHFAVAVYVA